MKKILQNGTIPANQWARKDSLTSHFNAARFFSSFSLSATSAPNFSFSFATTSARARETNAGLSNRFPALSINPFTRAISLPSRSISTSRSISPSSRRNTCMPPTTAAPANAGLFAAGSILVSESFANWLIRAVWVRRKPASASEGGMTIARPILCGGTLFRSEWCAGR